MSASIAPLREIPLREERVRLIGQAPLNLITLLGIHPLALQSVLDVPAPGYVQFPQRVFRLLTPAPEGVAPPLEERVRDARAEIERALTASEADYDSVWLNHLLPRAVIVSILFFICISRLPGIVSPWIPPGIFSSPMIRWGIEAGLFCASLVLVRGVTLFISSPLFVCGDRCSYLGSLRVWMVVLSEAMRMDRGDQAAVVQQGEREWMDRLQVAEGYREMARLLLRSRSCITSCIPRVTDTPDAQERAAQYMTWILVTERLLKQVIAYRPSAGRELENPPLRLELHPFPPGGARSFVMAGGPGDGRPAIGDHILIRTEGPDGEDLEMSFEDIMRKVEEIRVGAVPPFLSPVR